MSGPDSITEITRTGFGSRILGSVVGMLIGFLLLIASVILLYWNEGRAVQAATALGEGERAVVEAQAERPVAEEPKRVEKPSRLPPTISPEPA